MKRIDWVPIAFWVLFCLGACTVYHVSMKYNGRVLFANDTPLGMGVYYDRISSEGGKHLTECQTLAELWESLAINWQKLPALFFTVGFLIFLGTCPVKELE